MATDMEMFNGHDDIDALQKKLASQKLEEEATKEIVGSDDQEPNMNSGTPEGPRPPTVTEEGRKIMYVAAKSKSKPVAGSIARAIRDDKNSPPPVMSAVGAGSVNQTIKAIAIARGFLEADEVDLSVEVSRKSQGEVRDVFIFSLNKHARQPAKEEDKENEIYQDMRSSSQSTPKLLGGAIANNIRDGKIPRITAIGQKPVFRAISAIILARNYLKKDKKDIEIKPKFTHVTFENGADANAMMLTLVPRDVA